MHASKKALNIHHKRINAPHRLHIYPCPLSIITMSHCRKDETLCCHKDAMYTDDVLKHDRCQTIFCSIDRFCSSEIYQGKNLWRRVYMMTKKQPEHFLLIHMFKGLGLGFGVKAFLESCMPQRRLSTSITRESMLSTAVTYINAFKEGGVESNHMAKAVSNMLAKHCEWMQSQTAL